MEPPFILCGLGRVGWRVLEYLRAAGLPVVAIDTTCAPDDPRLLGVRLVKGDCRTREALEDAGVLFARGVLVLTSDDHVSISTALTVRQINPSVRVVVRMFNQNLVSRLGKAVHNVFALSTSNLTAPLLALTALTGHALGTFRLHCAEHGRRQVAGVTVTPTSPLRGRTLAEVAARHHAIVLAHFSEAGLEQVLQQVQHQAVLAPGDHLIVCGDPRHLAPLIAQVQDEALPDVRWASWLRRNWRVAWRTFTDVDIPVKIAGAVLAAVILVSTVVFAVAVDQWSIFHAFFRTVSIMATGADLNPDRVKFSDRLETFIAVLRIVGAALMAAFTAILTNYLLRARLFGALEVRRIPDGGHIIVCGLGNIGYRVVEELVQAQERVVVIERDAAGRFVTTCRRLGVPVIVGDGTVREVLRQAHAETARALIAATSDDLVNLEVALLVREIDPQKRVVLRLWDAQLAQTLREAADVRLALSVPALAAPAFVAALFGDWVQCVFLIGSRLLLAAVDISVGPADVYLNGQAVGNLVDDYHLVPVALVGGDQAVRQPAAGQHLRVGDRLTAIAELPDLVRLLQREATTRDYAAEAAGPPSF
jgi:Trk K+ transport system NAD-binding subunit